MFFVSCRIGAEFGLLTGFERERTEELFLCSRSPASVIWITTPCSSGRQIYAVIVKRRPFGWVAEPINIPRVIVIAWLTLKLNLLGGL